MGWSGTINSWAWRKQAAIIKNKQQKENYDTGVRVRYVICWSDCSIDWGWCSLHDIKKGL